MNRQQGLINHLPESQADTVLVGKKNDCDTCVECICNQTLHGFCCLFRFSLLDNWPERFANKLRNLLVHQTIFIILQNLCARNTDFQMDCFNS